MSDQKNNPAVGTRVSPAVKDALTALARAKNKTLGVYLRELISKAVKGVNAGKKVM